MKFKDCVKKYEKLQEVLGGKDLCERFYDISCTRLRTQGYKNNNLDIVKSDRDRYEDSDGDYEYLIEGVEVVLTGV